MIALLNNDKALYAVTFINLLLVEVVSQSLC